MGMIPPQGPERRVGSHSPVLLLSAWRAFALLHKRPLEQAKMLRCSNIWLSLPSCCPSCLLKSRVPALLNASSPWDAAAKSPVTCREPCLNKNLSPEAGISSSSSFTSSPPASVSPGLCSRVIRGLDGHEEPRRGGPGQGQSAGKERGWERVSHGLRFPPCVLPENCSDGWGLSTAARWVQHPAGTCTPGKHLPGESFCLWQPSWGQPGGEMMGRW